MVIESPSVFLPPLKHIKACPDFQISKAIACLRTIYLPEVRGSARRRHVTVNHDKQTSAPNESVLESIRADTFERSFTIQWLTRFISLFTDVGTEPRYQSQPCPSLGLLDEAASLLAICAGAAASGTITRTFTFSFPSYAHNRRGTGNASDVAAEGSPSESPVGLGPHEREDTISVTLRDAPLESEDFSSVGAQTWGGSCILAEMIAENPQQFGVFPREETHLSSRTDHCPPFRALELGAGTGLASLVLGKVMERIRPPCRVSPEPGSSGDLGNPDILSATDFHPSVLANLQVNIEANFPSDLADTSITTEVPSVARISPIGQRITVSTLDWSSVHTLLHPPCCQSASNPSLAHRKDADTPRSSVSRFVDRADFYMSPDVHLTLQCKHHDGPRTFGSDVYDPHSVMATPLLALNTPFDVIIGADIIYEKSHARWIRSCLELLLKKHPALTAKTDLGHAGSICVPSSPLFHLIIPLRRTHALESRSVEEIFAPAANVLASRQHTHVSHTRDIYGDQSTGSALRTLASGSVSPLVDSMTLELAIISQEDIVCDAYSDLDDPEEVIYRYYKIGWV